MKKCLYSILSVAFFAVLCLLGFSQNSFAISPSTIYVARSYSAISTTESNYYAQNIIGNTTIPVNLLNANNTASRTLYGFVVNFPVTGTNSANKYNSIRNISLTLSPPNGNLGVNRNWIWVNTPITATFYFYESSYSNLLGSCSATITPGATGWSVTEPRVWSCSGISTENYTPIGFVEIIVGTYNSSYQPNLGIATTTQYDWSGNFTISAISYDSVTTSDPAIGLLNQQINQNQTIINQNQQIINEQQATTDAINEQTQQEQDQYNQEKQEESEREESGNEDADQMSGIFQFSIPNPFLPILSMFTDGGSCVSIPTIASMVGSDNTQFCPWFPASVRNVLTPVIGLSSSIILFGFIISWLTGATRGSVEEVVEVSK